MGIDPATGQHSLLYNPREETWETHFQFELNSGMILGLTPVGRVTISQLQMNRPSQILARLHWMKLEMYP